MFASVTLYNKRVVLINTHMLRLLVLEMMVLASVCSPFLMCQDQPIEFPHNRHLNQGLECIDCHSRVDTRSEAGMPSIRKCMLCHEKVATNGPGVQILRQYSEKNEEVPWVRVYEFRDTANVKFRPSPHVRSGILCQTCHGKVSEMTVVTPEINHTMGTCLDCHRQTMASEDCIACHY